MMPLTTTIFQMSASLITLFVLFVGCYLFHQDNKKSKEWGNIEIGKVFRRRNRHPFANSIDFAKITNIPNTQGTQLIYYNIYTMTPIHRTQGTETQSRSSSQAELPLNVFKREYEIEHPVEQSELTTSFLPIQIQDLF